MKLKGKLLWVGRNIFRSTT